MRSGTGVQPDARLRECRVSAFLLGRRGSDNGLNEPTTPRLTCCTPEQADVPNKRQLISRDKAEMLMSYDGRRECNREQ